MQAATAEPAGWRLDAASRDRLSYSSLHIDVASTTWLYAGYYI